MDKQIRRHADQALRERVLDIFCDTKIYTDHIDVCRTPYYDYYTLQESIEISTEKYINSWKLGYKIFAATEGSPYVKFDLISTKIKSRNGYIVYNVAQLSKAELDFLVKPECVNDVCCGQWTANWETQNGVKVLHLYQKKRTCYVPSTTVKNRGIIKYDKDVYINEEVYRKLQFYGTRISCHIDQYVKYIAIIPWAEKCQEILDRKFLQHLIIGIVTEILNQEKLQLTGMKRMHVCALTGESELEKRQEAFEMVTANVVNRILMMHRYMAPETLVQDILDTDRKYIIDNIEGDYVSPVCLWFMYFRRPFIDTCRFFCKSECSV